MIYLITTTFCSSLHDGKLERLLKSIAPQSQGVRLLLVLQEGSEFITRQIEQKFKFVQAIHTEKKMGLSEARNIALQLLKANAPLHCDLIAFPDDDAWFYPNFFERLRNELHPDEDWICGSYSDVESKKNPVFPLRDALLEPDFILHYLCSITFFVRWRLVQKVGGFDERFGVGTRLNSAEDIDMGLRIWRAGANGRYVHHLVVGHNLGVVVDGEFVYTDRPDYWAGSMALVLKHLGILPRPHMLIAGRIRRGMQLVLKGTLEPLLFLKLMWLSFGVTINKNPISLDE